MRLMKMIGMAMMTTALCMPFTSCGGSDDDDNGGGGSIATSGKKLISIIQSSDGGSSKTSKFVYDANELLANVTYNGEKSLSCSWGDTQVTLKDQWGTTVCTIKDGKITQAVEKGDSDGSRKLTYDGNYLIYAQEEDGDINKWVWKNGNIVEYYDNDELRISCEYYTDKANKHYTGLELGALKLDDALPLDETDNFLAAHPSLIGVSNKNLLKKATHDDGEVYEFTYTLDSEGYPTTIVETVFYRGDLFNKTTYTLTWE